MARIITIATAAAVVALTLAGCGSDKAAAPESSSSAASSSSAEASTSAAAPVDDEQAIRDLVAAQAEAFSKGDWDGLANLTCAKFQEQARDPGANLVPPIDTFGTPEQAATFSVQELSDQLAQEFGSRVPKETLDRVAQAIVDNDEPAYQSAMLDLMTQSSTLTVEKVDNIKIDGDSATADVTSTRTMGDNPPETRTDNAPFVKENGRWLDCSDPAG